MPAGSAFAQPDTGRNKELGTALAQNHQQQERQQQEQRQSNQIHKMTRSLKTHPLSRYPLSLSSQDTLSLSDERLETF